LVRGHRWESFLAKGLRGILQGILARRVPYNNNHIVMRFSTQKVVALLGWGSLLLSPQSSDHDSGSRRSGMEMAQAANNYYNEEGGNNNYYNADGGNNDYYENDGENNNYYNNNAAEGGDDNYKNNYENYGVATDDQYVMYNEDGEELTFDGISVMPVSCIN
jgi:hypothetical protein